MPQDDFEPGEVLIADVPKRFEDGIRDLGFRVVERLSMPRIGINVVRLRTPKKMPVKKAIRALSSRFPAAIIDANHRFDLAAKSSRGMFPRVAAGWSPTGRRCGRGVRIGLIDSSVDVSHRVLKGQNIEYRSFHSERRNPGPSGHGTTMAALLVGKPQRNGWSGLLPGAKLYAASMFEIDRRDKTVGSGVGLLKALE